MMSYMEERKFKAMVLVKYARAGFVASAKEVANIILASNDADDILTLVESLVNESKVLDDANRELEYVNKTFDNTEDENYETD